MSDGKNSFVFYFDFDGTLCNSKPILKAIISEMRLEPKYQKMGQFSTLPLDSFEKLSTLQLFAALRLSPLQIRSVVKEVKERLLKRHTEIDFFEGIRQQVTLLSRWSKVAVLSSNSIELLKLKCHGMEFDELLSNRNLFGKASTLKKIRKKIAGSELIYVGDELRDIQAANKAGIVSIGVSWGLDRAEALRAEGAALIIQDPSQLNTSLRQFTLAPESLEKR